MNIKPKRLISNRDLIEAETAFHSVFKTAETTSNPFESNIRVRAVLFDTPYGFDEVHMNAFSQCSVNSGDTSAAYISLIEGYKEKDFDKCHHWMIDLFNDPYEELRKADIEWFPLMENAIYSTNGSWGVIFAEYGHSLLGCDEMFFGYLETYIPRIKEEVFDFIDEIKREIKSYPQSFDYFNEWVPKLLSNIYGSDQAKSMLSESGLNMKK